MKVYAFPLGTDGLVAGPRRTLIDFGDEEGSDGMTVDTEGRIYLASRRPSRPGILVIDPTGKELAYLKTGEPQKVDNWLARIAPLSDSAMLGLAEDGT